MIKQFTLFVSMCLIFGLNAQEEDGTYYVSQDLSTWNSLSFKLKPSKAWSIALSEEFRFKTNSSELDQFFTELKTTYKFYTGIWISGGYRFIGDKTEDAIDLEQRFHGDIGYSFDVERFDFSFRLRGQTRDDLGEKRAEDGDYGRRALRLKFETKYNIKKWKLDPVASVEIFRENGKYVDAQFSKFRTTIGTQYKFEKIGTIAAFYRYQKDLNTDYGLNHSIIGLQYKFTLKTY